MDDQFAFRYSSVIGSEDSELEEYCGDVGALSAGAVQMLTDMVCMMAMLVEMTAMLVETMGMLV
jgi:hypothetical protein